MYPKHSVIPCLTRDLGSFNSIVEAAVKYDDEAVGAGKNLYTSIEIFVPTNSSKLNICSSNLTIQIKQTNPPVSDRGISSLWQDKFSSMNGILVHVADPSDIIVKKDRYYAYDIFSNPEESHRKLKFLPKYQIEILTLLNQLCKLSEDETVFITFDAWLGPKKKFMKKLLTEKELKKSFLKQKALRNNTFRRYQII